MTDLSFIQGMIQSYLVDSARRMASVSRQYSGVSKELIDLRTYIKETNARVSDVLEKMEFIEKDNNCLTLRHIF